MKQAICIQCHNKPEQINALINNMPKQDFDFFIHVDKKSNIKDKIHKLKNVYFTERVNVHWGRFSQVEATLKMLELVNGKKYSYIHLISGNDYFVKPPYYFKQIFSYNNKEQYIESTKLPEDSTWSWKGMDRVSVWYPQWLIQRPSKKIRRIIRIVYREFVMRTGIFRRKVFPVPKFYGGSQWFSITGECVEWMKLYLKNHPEYSEFFKHSLCSDEIFFSTLIRYSPFKDQIMNNSLRFMIWNNTVTGGPKELKLENVNDMIQSNYIWARKIVSLKVINKIQKEIDSMRVSAE